MTTVLCLLVAQFCVFAAEQPVAFGLTNIWNVELRISAPAWKTLRNSRDFIRADMTVNGQRLTNVAVRQKGGGTSGGAQAGRPPLHINMKVDYPLREQKSSA